MTGEIGIEYHYICEGCLERFGPRGLKMHAKNMCGPAATVTRLDLWLLSTMDECPECEHPIARLDLPEGADSVHEWHENGAAEIRVQPCGHMIDTHEYVTDMEHEYEHEHRESR